MDASGGKRSGTQDAIKLLKEDHRKVEKLFKEFESLKEEGDEQAKEECVRKACQELTNHAEIEEELFYPAVREAIDKSELVDEATVEHNSLKDLIAQLEQLDPSDPMYDATVKVLSEYVKHHVKEEEGEIFPQAQEADVDLERIGEEIVQRKQEMEPAES